MKNESIETKFNAVAREMLAFRDAIRKLTDNMTDDEILELARVCEQASKPGPHPFGGGSKNFDSPEWQEVADILLAEVGYRHAVADMREKKLSYYCIHCRGEHTPEHLAELRKG
jgi:hypothetical protein